MKGLPVLKWVRHSEELQIHDLPALHDMTPALEVLKHQKSHRM